MSQFWSGVGASLVAAAIAAAASYFYASVRARRRIEAAPRKYVQHLEQLIKSAIAEGPDRAHIWAHAIVATRDDLRMTMISLGRLLNSEIDELAVMTGLGTEELFNEPLLSRSELSRSDKRELFDVIQVLWRKWPSKKSQIETEIRKLLVELGLL